MFGAIILIIFLFFISVPLLGKFKEKFPWLSTKLLQHLYWYHILFAIIYYAFTRTTTSDSKAYYFMASQYVNWLDAYESGTVFLHFVSYPFVKYLMFSYEMMMVLYAWFGY